MPLEKNKPNSLQTVGEPHIPSDSNSEALEDALEASMDSQPIAIVGIGASAGGLDALERFFSNVPEQTGLAYVVVQHLSTSFKSLMHELLARYTKLPIHRVENSMRVEADTIYLNPPGQNMILDNDHLLLSEQDVGELPQSPIDIFFRSLAYSAEKPNVAVVLSGTGSDGSRGIVDVNQAGGMVVVQSPESAGFDGMPRNAMAREVVDIITTPEDMPRQIMERIGVAIDISESSLDRVAADTEDECHQQADSLLPNNLLPNSIDGEPTQNTELVSLFSIMNRRFQIDFSLYKSATIQRRIERRMSAIECDSFATYVEQLAEDPDEQEQLFRDFLVDVTEFFRDASAFQHLEAALLGTMRSLDDPVFRIWVAGCATGEEAYSMAILADRCRRRLEKDIEIQIFATDMHPDSLAIAAAGTYTTDALAALSVSDIEEYFTVEQGHYSIAKSLRTMVTFTAHNLLQDPPFTRLHLVSCRNVLIYLRGQYQDKVLSRFHFGLKKDGILFLGSSEHLAATMVLDFKTINAQWRIFRKQSDASIRHSFHPMNYTNFRPLIAEQRVHRDQLAKRNELYEALLESCNPPSLLMTFW